MVGFITLADAKDHLVVLDDADNDLIQRLIDGASRMVEERTGYVAELREQTFSFDRFAVQLELRLRPIETDTVEVAYLDGNGDEQSFDEIRIVDKNGTTRVVPAIGSSWPATARAIGVVTVTAMVGFGDNEEAISESAPSNIMHAVRLCVGSWYDSREVGALPDAAIALLDDKRARRV